MEKNDESEFLRCARTPTPKFNSMKLVLGGMKIDNYVQVVYSSIFICRTRVS